MKIFFKYLFPIVALAVLIFVWSVSIDNNGGWGATFSTDEPRQFVYNIFRLVGLTAFALIGFQILIGSFLGIWEKLYGPNFYKFHAYEGLTTLLFALLHPLLLLIYLYILKIWPWEFAKQFPITYYFGPIALFIMIITVTTAGLAVLMNRPKLQKSWHLIHLANYLVFILVFFHSYGMGSDVGPGSSLRPLWWFFFGVMIIGFLYRRIYQPLYNKFQTKKLPAQSNVAKETLKI